MDKITKLANHTRMPYDSTTFKAYVHRDRPRKPTLELLYICCSDNLCILSPINKIYLIHTGDSALVRPQSPFVCCSSVSFACMLLSQPSEKQRFPTALSKLKETEITEVCNLYYIPFNTYLAIQSKSETTQDDMTDWTDPLGLLFIILFFSKWPET